MSDHPTTAMGTRPVTYSDEDGASAFGTALSSQAIEPASGLAPTGLQSADADECEHCHDSGYVEFVSGGIWTGENITSRYEFCDCLCGQDAMRAAEAV